MRHRGLTAMIAAIAISLLLSIGAAATSTPAVSYEEKVVNGLSLKVVIVNQKHPSIGVKTVLADTTLGATKSFAQTVREENAIVSINGNFFESYKDYKSPIGNVISNGELLYSAAGLPNVGFTESGEILFGTPGYFIQLTTVPRSAKEDAQGFIAYDTNVRGQGGNVARLYTPAFGSSFGVTYPGTVYVLQKDTFVSYQTVAAGESMPIPADGYVLYHGAQVPAYEAPSNPSAIIGASVVQNYVLQNPDAETAAAFSGKSLTAMLAGNSRIIANGSTAGARINVAVAGNDQWNHKLPRTVVGKLQDGRLIIVSTPGATLPKLAEALVAMGCTDAVNVDGGGSTALAVDGAIKATPGRNLTVTFHVYNKNISVQNTNPRFTSSNPMGFTPRYQVAAQALSQLGNTGMMRPEPATGNFYLDRAPTRAEVAIMLVRMLGGEQEALEKNYSHPFTDVEQSASPYIGYLWYHGLTKGINQTQFGGSQKATKEVYITYLLRVLGYSDVAGGDFTYAGSVEYAQYYLALTPPKTYYEWGWREFLRDDMAVLTYRALNSNMKSGANTLAGHLLSQGVFTQTQAERAELIIR